MGGGGEDIWRWGRGILYTCCYTMQILASFARYEPIVLILMIFETLKWRLKWPEDFLTTSLDITHFFLFVRYFLLTTLSLQPARHGLLNQGHAERTDFPISTLPSCLHTCVSKNASSMQSLLYSFTCCCSVAQVVV